MKWTLDEYFSRIGYSGEGRADLESLRTLHRQHAFEIPFENIDIQLGRSISIALDQIFEKLVRARRGGYCFEMNGLFVGVLKRLGFKIHQHCARVVLGGVLPKDSPRTHQMTTVELDGERWLVDVGFGAHGLIEPLRVQTASESAQFAERFRLCDAGRHGLMLQALVKGEFMDQYCFTNEESMEADYAIANHYTATAVNSIFVQRLICTKPTPGGRVTLGNGVLIRAEKNPSGDERKVERVRTASELDHTLREVFGIQLEAAELENLANLPLRSQRLERVT